MRKRNITLIIAMITWYVAVQGEPYSPNVINSHKTNDGIQNTIVSESKALEDLAKRNLKRYQLGRHIEASDNGNISNSFQMEHNKKWINRMPGFVKQNLHTANPELRRTILRWEKIDENQYWLWK